MTSKTQIQVGIVEEISGAKPLVGDKDSKWHYKCGNCGQRLRFPAYLEIEFDCNSCKQPYSVTKRGAVYTDVVGKASAWKQVPAMVSKGQPPEKMRLIDRASSLISGMVDVAGEVNERSHGKRLREGLIDAFHKMNEVHLQISNAALIGFSERFIQLNKESLNWSPEGCIKYGRELQRRARIEYDFNQAESYALWLTGAWLESKWRNFDDADFVRATLEDLAERIRDE
jgi:hypothetical protein